MLHGTESGLEASSRQESEPASDRPGRSFRPRLDRMFWAILVISVSIHLALVWYGGQLPQIPEMQLEDIPDHYATFGVISPGPARGGWQEQKGVASAFSPAGPHEAAQADGSSNASSPDLIRSSLHANAFKARACSVNRGSDMRRVGVIGLLGTSSGSRLASNYTSNYASNSAPADQLTTRAVAAAPSGLRASRAVTAAPADRNGWYQSTYQGGAGSREALEKAVSDGILIDGQRVKLDAFTRRYAQSFPFPSGQALAVSTRLDRARPSPSGGQVFLEVGLQALAQESGARSDLNVVLVLDTSGSMASEGKLEAVKAAAHAVVDRLTSGDRLGIVSYSSDAYVLATLGPLTSRGPLHDRIDTLEATGGTNIHEGLKLAYAQFERADPNAGNLVIVLTDGQATEGVRDPARFEALARRSSQAHIATTTIGVGTSYDDDLMMRISRAGGGNYHFIKDAGDVQAVVRRELDDLSTSVARGVKLRIELPENVQLVRVLGSDQLSTEQTEQARGDERRIDQEVYQELGIRRDRRDTDEPGVKMLIPSFRANDAHVVILELAVPRGTGRLEPARVHVQYKDVVFKANRDLTLPVRADYASSQADSLASIDPAVKKNVLGFRTGEALMAAARGISEGRIADAARAIDDQMVLLGVAAREWSDRDLERDAALLGRYRDTLTAYHRRGWSDEVAAYLGKSLSYSAYQRLN